MPTSTCQSLKERTYLKDNVFIHMISMKEVHTGTNVLLLLESETPVVMLLLNLVESAARLVPLWVSVFYYFAKDILQHCLMINYQQQSCIAKYLRRGGRFYSHSFCSSSDSTVVKELLQEAQLPLRNRASATYFFVAKLISIAHSCL